MIETKEEHSMTPSELSLLDPDERQSWDIAMQCGCPMCVTIMALLPKVARLRQENHELVNAEENQRNERLSAETRADLYEGYLTEVASALNLPEECLHIASCHHVAHVARQVRENAEKYFEKLSAAESHISTLTLEKDSLMQERDRYKERVGGLEEALRRAITEIKEHNSEYQYSTSKIKLDAMEAALEGESHV